MMRSMRTWMWMLQLTPLQRRPGRKALGRDPNTQVPPAFTSMSGVPSYNPAGLLSVHEYTSSLAMPALLWVSHVLFHMCLVTENPSGQI